MATEPETLMECMYQDGKQVTKTLRFEGGVFLYTCTPCAEAVKAKHKKKICQYCGIPIMPGWKKPPVGGLKHDPNCPQFALNEE